MLVTPKDKRFEKKDLSIKEKEMVKFWYNQGRNIDWICNRYNISGELVFSISQ